MRVAAEHARCVSDGISFHLAGHPLSLFWRAQLADRLGGGKGLIHAACGHKSTTGALLALDMHSGVYDMNGHGQPGYVVTAKCSAVQSDLLAQVCACV